MVISGVVVVSRQDMVESVLDALQNIENVTTYGIHKDYHIVAVLEGTSSKELERLTEKLSTSIPGILGVFPAYVNFELDESAENADILEESGNLPGRKQ